MLTDTSLCSIVRDEKENPAGGIVDFVRSTCPFVEQAVIIDTGSKDGTRELLEELEQEYPSLFVYDREFDDFASCRNFALNKVQTGKALVLDADERLFPDDFQKLEQDISTYNLTGYCLGFMHIFNNRSIRRGAAHNLRLVNIMPGLHYKNMMKNMGEELFLDDLRMDSPFGDIIYLDVDVKHFCVSVDAFHKKRKDFYENVVQKGTGKNPSEIGSFREWKKANPLRDQYC